MAIACDVTDRAAVREAVRKAEACLGPTARLVANAGGALTTSAAEFSAAHIEAVVDLNLIGVANCIEMVLPGMLERGAAGDRSVDRRSKRRQRLPNPKATDRFGPESAAACWRSYEPKSTGRLLS